MTTTKFVTVKLENKPGTLGKAARALSEANVNIDAFAVDVNGNARFLTDNPSEASTALDNAGLDPQTVEALRVQLPNTPGQLANLAEKLGQNGVNIESVFGAAGADNQASVYIRVQDIKKAQPVIEDVLERSVQTT